MPLHFLKSKSASQLSLLISSQSPFSHQSLKSTTDHASVIKSRTEDLNGTNKDHSDLTTISHAAHHIKALKPKEVRSEPSTTNMLMLIAMMDNKSDLNSVHAQDLKVKERTSFQRLVTPSTSRVLETSTQPGTSTLVLATDFTIYCCFF